MTTFSFNSFRIFKISPYINLTKILGRILAPPSWRRPGADAPPCPFAMPLLICETELTPELALKQWCSGSGATGAIAPVPIFQGGAPLQFLVHLFLVNFAYILQKLAL